MAMKPKKMRGGGMAGVKKMRGGGMAGKKVTTGRSGPREEKLAAGKQATAVKKAGARRAGGGMGGMAGKTQFMKKGGTDLATLRKMAKDKGYKLVKS